MKRIIVLLLVLVLSCFAFASCDMLPEEVMDKLSPVLEKIGVETTEKEPEAEAPAHEHEFVLKEKVEPSCSKKGREEYECACGETKTEYLPKSHPYQLMGITQPSCTQDGYESYLCHECGSTKIEHFGEPLGHNVSEFVEYSRMMPCTNDGCSYAIFPEGNGKYSEIIVYQPEKVEANIATFETAYAEFTAIMEAAAKYDKTLHAYEEGSATHSAYLIMEAKYDELYEVLEFIVAQYQIASLEWYISGNNTNYNYIAKVRTELIADFYSFSGDIAESMYREYYYYGMSDAEINAYVAESDSVSDPEYTELVNANDQIESMFAGLDAGSAEVPKEYSKFAQNNKKIATKLGYANYLDYAYESIYGRDYSYTDAAEIYEYIKTYIVPVYNAMYNHWYYNGAYNATYGDGSFFEVYDQNKSLNDYIDLLTIQGNKTVSFSDEFNGLIGNGTCFVGGSLGTAYVTSLYGLDFDGSDLPIAYFSDSYCNFFTVAHEFGHYMNEIYSEGKYSQSYDLLEMHSQGNEMLFLAYLNNNKGAISSVGLQFLNEYQPLNMFFSIVNGVAVDAFERAIYTDYYEGPNSEEIMDYDEASGLYITYDEYDLLFDSIYEDMGVDPTFRSARYWKYAVVSSPCYYISYAVSALPTLQLLPMGVEDFDAASEAYLKLFSYVDTYENGGNYMSTEEILEYAGLMSFTDEELYQYLNEYFMAKYS